SSAHPVLTIGIQEAAEAAGVDVLATGSLRRDEGGLQRFLTCAAELFVRGTDIDWAQLFEGTGARRVDLPTYAFQHTHYWAPTSPAGVGDAAAARFGMEWETHPLLGGALPLAETGEVLFTGRISLVDHPWIADHAVSGRTLLPGTAFVELVLHAAAATGSAGLEELGLEAPLVLPGRGAVQVQVRVGAADGSGRRTVNLHSRTEADGAPWTRHASGVLAPAPAAPRVPAAADWAGADGAAWPPPGTEPVEPDEVYARFADLGYEYGDVFAGITAAWRRPGEVFAEIRLPASARSTAGLYGVHPALLDAALQPWLAGGLLDVPDDAVLLPFAWQGATLHATGADALRVRLARTADGAVSLEAVDPAGAPVLTLDALVMRPVPRERLAALLGAADDGLPLYRIAWQGPAPAAHPVPTEAGRRNSVHRLAVAGTDGTGLGSGAAGVPVDVHPDLAALFAAVEAGAPVPDAVVVSFPDSDPAPDSDPDTEPTPGRAPAPEAVHETTARCLALLREWLGHDERLGAARLVVLTRRAVATRPGEALPGLSAAGLWGLVRSAQSEHPGRFVLADTDGTPASAAALVEALATGAPQFGLRDGEPLTPVLTPVLARRPEDDAPGTPPAGFDPEGTVLVTGGTGTLGRLLARHLVTAHGVRGLLLVSRSGPAADGATELERELTALGARVEIAACDTGHRSELEALLSRVPAAHPLTGVVHAAGVLDDGALTALDAARLATVLRPKADAALHLHELTAHLPLSAFVLFSGAAGLLGRPGQANYAAANTFVDALAQHRRAAGLPAVSLAWGLWGEATGMTGHLSDTDLRRMRRSGLAPMSNEQGLALFDRALAAPAAAADEALLVPLRLDTAALRREQAAHGPDAVPVLLRALVPPAAPAPRAATTATPVAPAAAAAGGIAPGEETARALALRLSGLDPAARHRELLTLVRGEIAAVLGFAGPGAVEPARPLRETGFDSLTAVELRNRLTAATGLRLSPTLVFDHPTAQAVAEHLGGELRATGNGSAAAGEAALAGLAALEAALAALEADDIAHETVHRRLTRLVASVAAAAGPPAAPAPLAAVPAAAAGTGLDSADDEELFAFIEEQL
ncbi:type I polyketide synthase, partial [Streptomyces sp. M-16]|uniref:type I polyketide synthase n=1 Tax=Streptomyces sp. M-16 TaxID=3233040 RepID=UPI003F96975B